MCSNVGEPTSINSPYQDLPSPVVLGHPESPQSEAIDRHLLEGPGRCSCLETCFFWDAHVLGREVELVLLGETPPFVKKNRVVRESDSQTGRNPGSVFKLNL